MGDRLATIEYTWAENGGLCPFEGGERCPHLTQCGRAEDYLRAKFHLNPSNRLATINQRYRQNRTDRQTDRQRYDRIGRTVLQTVAKKRTSNLIANDVHGVHKYI